MKIPLDVLPHAITLSATISGPRVFGHVNFTIDTGTPQSFIGSVDMQKLGIPLSRLSFKDGTKIYWGDSPFRLGKLRKVEIWVKSADDTLHIFHLPYLYVSPDHVHTKEAPVSPNLLGLDFFRSQKLRFSYDAADGTSHLEC